MKVFTLMLTTFFLAHAAQAASVCTKDICVDVEVMSTTQDMKRGLQGRDSLEQNHGMLFVFDKDDIHRFWMKEMRFAIDMIWIDKQQRIVSIASSCEACTKDPCQIYAPSHNSRYVLEVPAGFALAHQLTEGDALSFKGIN